MGEASRARRAALVGRVQRAERTEKSERSTNENEWRHCGLRDWNSMFNGGKEDEVNGDNVAMFCVFGSIAEVDEIAIMDENNRLFFGDMPGHQWLHGSSSETRRCRNVLRFHDGEPRKQH